MIWLLPCLLGCGNHAAKKNTAKTVRAWTEPVKDSVYRGCLSSLPGKDTTLAKEYCSCLLDQYVSHFPGPDSLLKADSLALLLIDAHCSDAVGPAGGSAGGKPSGWLMDDRDHFMKSCVGNLVAQKISYADAIKFCNCSQEKMEAQFPDPADANKVSDSTLQRLEELCLPR